MTTDRSRFAHPSIEGSCSHCGAVCADDPNWGRRWERQDGKLFCECCIDPRARVQIRA